MDTNWAIQVSPKSFFLGLVLHSGWRIGTAREITETQDIPTNLVCVYIIVQ